MEFYRAKGYREISVPWVASTAAMEMTHPGAAWGGDVPGGHLVASAEQSFAHMLLSREISPTGRYVACTPCWRIENPITEWSRSYFMKVELFDGVTGSVTRVLNDAEHFFSKISNVSSEHFRTIETHDGFDIELGGREIGSYGFRHSGEFSWIYGTGIAEPRFTMAESSVIASKC